MATWINNDGIRVTFGEAVRTEAAAPNQAGENLVVGFEVDLADLATGVTNFGVRDGIAIPKGAIIDSASITVLTAATSGGSAALNVGLTLSDGTGGDADGIDAAVALTALNAAGKRVVCDGALINTALASTLYFAADYDTAAFTAGRVRVDVHYRPRLNREAQ